MLFFVLFQSTVTKLVDADTHASLATALHKRKKAWGPQEALCAFCKRHLADSPLELFFSCGHFLHLSCCKNQLENKNTTFCPICGPKKSIEIGENSENNTSNRNNSRSPLNSGNSPPERLQEPSKFHKIGSKRPLVLEKSRVNEGVELNLI